MKKNILLTNVYTYSNKGDAAIVISLIREIKRVFSNKILIQTTDKINDQDKYGVPVSGTLMWILLSSNRNKSFLFRIFNLFTGLLELTLTVILYKLKINTKIFLRRELEDYINEVEQAEFVIACGGGYIRTSDSSFNNTILLAITCLNFLIPKYLNKKIYLYSQSIGPVHGDIQLQILKYVLNKIDLIEPREEISFEFLKTLKISTPYTQTADAALLLGDYGKVKTEKFNLNKYKFKVGLTVRKWFKNEKDFNHYIDSVASAVDYLADKYNAQVFYIPQVIAEKFGDDDRVTARKLYDQVKRKSSFTLIQDDLPAEEIIGLCGAMDIFIGTRMHSNIFALINYVPVVAIEYEYKTRGIMLGLDLNDMIIDIKDINFDLLKTKIDLLLNDKERYINKIKNNLPKQIKNSQKAIELIKENNVEIP